MYELWKGKLFKGRKKWLFPLVVSDLPMFLLMITYVRHNFNDIWAYSISGKISFALVGIWTYIGPLMILWWRESAEALVENIDYIPGSNDIARKAFEQKATWFTIFSLFWTLTPPFILLSPKGQIIMKSFHFFGIADWNYRFFLCCVFYVAHQTTVFYRFLFSSWKLIKAISENKAVMRYLISNEGKRLSLSFVGSFVAKSVIYTSSGILFFPILVDFISEFYSETQTKQPWIPLDTPILVFVLMGIFLVVILLYLLSINHLVNQKAQLVKDEMITELEEWRDRFTLLRKKNFRQINRAIYYQMEEQALDTKIQCLVAVNVNPIGMDQQMQLFSGIFMTSFLPAMFSIVLGQL